MSNALTQFGRAMEAAKAKVAEVFRQDSWLNVTLGLGGHNDPRTHSIFKVCQPMAPQLAMNLYLGNDLARLICSFKPGLALKNKWEVCIDQDEKRQQALSMRIEELNLTSLIQEAAIWGQVTGGGAILLGIDDGKQPWEPLDLDADGNPTGIRRINYVKVFDRRRIARIIDYDTDPTSPHYGEPSLYGVQHRTGTTSDFTPIHASRLIVFPGILTGEEEKWSNGGWDYSILDSIYDALKEFGIGWSAATRLIHSASQGVYGVKNLMDIIDSENGEADFQKRMRVINAGLSNANALVIDAESERYEKVATSFAGLPDMMDRLFNRLAAASRIPVTMLAGQAPAGLNATGKSDLETAYGEAEVYQRDVLKPRMRTIVRLLMAEGNAKEPDQWRIEFAPVNPDQQRTKAELRKMVAETDAIYLDKGVLQPSNVAIDRYGKGEFSMETTIDVALYQQLEVGENKLLVEGGSDNKELGTVGAQVDALSKIIDQVAQGTIAQETAIAQVVALFGLTEDVARKMIGQVTVTPPAPEVAPINAAPPPPASAPSPAPIAPAQ